MRGFVQIIVFLALAVEITVAVSCSGTQNFYDYDGSNFGLYDGTSYQANSSCIYEWSTSDGDSFPHYVVAVNFLDIEKSVGCVNDYINITINEGSQHIATLCGNASDYSLPLLYHFDWRFYHLEITFISNGAIEGLGFLANVTLDCTIPQSCQDTGTNFTVTTNMAISNPAPFDNSNTFNPSPIPCQWAVHSPSGGVNRFVLYAMNVYNGDLCRSQGLTIYDGTTTAAPILMETCTCISETTPTVYSSGADALVVWHADGQPNKGYFLDITQGLTPTLYYQYCVPLLSLSNAQFLGTALPYGQVNYMATQCTWNFDAGENRTARVYIYEVDFPSGSDASVTIIDGYTIPHSDSSSSYPELDFISSTTSNMTRVYETASQYATIEFYGDEMIGRGFYGRVYSIGGGCGDPNIPQNGYLVSGTNYSVGGQQTFACYAGYDMSGSATLTCTYDEVWSSALPTCQIKQCPDPGSVAHSNSTCPPRNRVYNATCTYVCDTGYHANGGDGTNTLRCDATGTWQGSAMCVRDRTSSDAGAEIDDVTPLLVPLLGGVPMTVSGQFWGLPLQSLTVGGVEVNRSGLVISGASATSSELDQTATFTCPVVGVTGYATIRLVDVYGDEATLDYELYATDDCPSQGQYGVGADCRDCPAGAYCPGGNRMWPLVGYWNSGEDAGYVKACPYPASRCLGGRTSACAAGYAGPLCAQCAAGYYARGSECIVCPSQEEDISLYVVNAVFFLLMAIVFAILKDQQLTYAIALFKGLQLLRVAGQQTGAELPTGLKQIYNYLALVTFDYNFLKPSCGAEPTPASFSKIFWGNAVVIAALISPALILQGVLQIVWKRKRQYYFNRMFRTTLVYFSLIYFVVTERVLEAVQCTEIGGTYVLQADTSELCTWENPVRVVGWIGVIVFCVGMPVGFVIALIAFERQKLLTNPTILARYGYMYDSFLLARRRYLFGVAQFFHLLLTALCWTVFPTGITAFSVAISSFSAMIIGLVIAEPHRHKVMNAFDIIAYGLGLFTTLLNLTKLSTITLNEVAQWAIPGAVLLAVCLLALISMFRKPVHDDLKEASGEKDAKIVPHDTPFGRMQHNPSDLESVKRKSAANGDGTKDDSNDANDDDGEKEEKLIGEGVDLSTPQQSAVFPSANEDTPDSDAADEQPNDKVAPINAPLSSAGTPDANNDDRGATEGGADGASTGVAPLPPLLPSDEARDEARGATGTQSSGRLGRRSKQGARALRDGK